MEKEKNEPKPADMHSDGVHFDKGILESKRNDSARAADDKTKTSNSLNTSGKDEKKKSK